MRMALGRAVVGRGEVVLGPLGLGEGAEGAEFRVLETGGRGGVRVLGVGVHWAPGELWWLTGNLGPRIMNAGAWPPPTIQEEGLGWGAMLRFVREALGLGDHWI